jgi:hypothetical protein
MNEKHMLTFEISASGEEVEIHLDKRGAAVLQKTLSRLLDSPGPLPRHDHLMTPAWAGTELSEENQHADSTLINRVTIRLWR